MPALLLALGQAGCGHAGFRVTQVYATIANAVGQGEVQIQIKRAFLETYKDRVTIQATMTVDRAMGSPNPNPIDGDLHFAGRAPEIGLRLVSEILNAATVDSAIKRVQRAQDSHVPLELSGVWRLWPEHALGITQEQGQPVQPVTSVNPDHVFEIHPVTRLAGMDLLDTFHPLDHYLPGSAKGTLDHYQQAECTLSANNETITLTAPTGLVNDVRFLLQRGDEEPVVVEDGTFLVGSALDLDGNLLVERLRIVLVKGTPPERAIRDLPRGTRLEVWGLPRVSMAELAQRLRSSGANRVALKGRLPYEIVILGVYPSKK